MGGLGEGSPDWHDHYSHYKQSMDPEQAIAKRWSN